MRISKPFTGSQPTCDSCLKPVGALIGMSSSCLLPNTDEKKPEECCCFGNLLLEVEGCSAG